MPVVVRCTSGYRVAVLWLLAAAVSASAATPRDELLRYVPDDVGFCFILQDSRDQLKTLASSPFAEQLDKSPLGRALNGSKEIQKLLDVEKQLKQLIGLSSDELRDDILGDAVVFAFRPAPPGKAEQEAGLVLLRARDAKKLQALIDHVNNVQKNSGQLKSLDDREHNGLKYFRRVEQKETNYYYLRGPVLIFTGQESMLKEALDRDRTMSADAEPALARRLRDAGLPRALFTAYVNPRAFDEMLAAKTAESQVASDVAFLKNFSRYWKALDAAFISVSADKDFSLTVALQGRPDDLPTAARKFFTEAAKPSELAAAFPENALLATSRRVDFAALAEVLGDFMTKENRDHFQKQLSFGGVLGKNYLQDIGPDVGMVLFAPAAREKTWLPHAAFALKVAPGSDPARPTDEAIVTTLKSFALLAVVGHNQQHTDEPIEVTKVEQGKREVHTLVGDKAFPPGVQPSLCLTNGYLLLADSPDTIRQIADALAKPAKPPEGTAVPLLRLSFKDLRGYLKEHREPLVQSMAERDKITNEEAAERLDNLLGVLQFVDRMEVSQRTGTGRTTLTIALQPAFALKK
jgi:hypothetical protein